MTTRRTPPRLRSLFWNIFGLGLFLLFVSVVWLTAKGSEAASETRPVGFTSDDQGAIQLPDGMDPMGVVRMVERNREEVLQETSGHGFPQASAELGPTFQDGGAPVYCTAASEQSWPAVAFDGTNYLVVWQDLRGGSDYDIYGARVSVGGSVLDPSGIVISTAVGSQEYPAIAFDGTNYLVVWQDYRSGSDYDIYGARVSVGGSVLDPSGIAISTAADLQWYPAVAFDGTNYLAVWQDLRSGSSWDIYGARVSKGGSVVDPSGIAISTDATNQLRPAVAFDGTNYLAVWQDYRSGSDYDIYGARVSKAGSVVDATGIAISTAVDYQYVPAVAFGGANYLAVWQDGRSGSGYDIYGARVSVGGTVVDASGIAISTAAKDQCDPAIAFDGTDYLAVWRDIRSASSYDIYGARVSAAGSVLDPSGIAISTAVGSQEYPAIAFDGTNCLVVWQDYRSASDYDIYGARVNVGGSVLDPGGFTDLAFASASATASNDHVTLRWQMTVDVTTASFVIRRSESLKGDFAALGVCVTRGTGLSFSCDDYSVQPGKTYWYEIALRGSSGEEVYGPIEVHVESVPTAYRAYQNYPNPFNPLCTIRYDISRPGRVSLRVYDVDGSLVRTLVDGWREPGVYSEMWDGKGDDGGTLPSGVYFYRLETGDVSEAASFVAVRKMVLLR
jgi:phosphoribosylformylglycinamidine (FGAM) synthase PurS component